MSLALVFFVSTALVIIIIHAILIWRRETREEEIRAWVADEVATALKKFRLRETEEEHEE